MNKIDENKFDSKEIKVSIFDNLLNFIAQNKSNIKVKDQSVANSQPGFLKLYLGSFDSLSQASEFKQFIKKRNNNFLNKDNLKIFEQLEGEKKLFRVELMNISSIEEGKKLCSMLSSRQFSCLLVNEQGVK